MCLTRPRARLGLQVLLFALLLGIPAASVAQVLEPGARIRVTHVGGSRITGTFELMSADSIRVNAAGGSVAVPLSGLAALDLSMGRRRRFWPNMLATAGAFAALGGLAAAATYEPCDHCIVAPESRAEALLWGAVVGGMVGVPAGIVVGAAVRHERWAPVYRPAVKPLRISIRPTFIRGVGIAATAAVR